MTTDRHVDKTTSPPVDKESRGGGVTAPPPSREPKANRREQAIGQLVRERQDARREVIAVTFQREQARDWAARLESLLADALQLLATFAVAPCGFCNGGQPDYHDQPDPTTHQPDCEIVRVLTGDPPR
jgi:hypothetical protein